MPPASAQRSEAPERGSSASTWKDLQTVSLATILLALAALNSPVSQASMTPVYGSLPSGVNHKEAMVLTVTLGFLINVFVVSRKRTNILPWIAVWMFFTPIMGLYQARVSDLVGPIAGPMILGVLSCHMVLMSSVVAAGRKLDDLSLETRVGKHAGLVLPVRVISGLAFFTAAERIFAARLPQIMARSPWFDPTTFQLLIASMYSLLSRSKVLALAAPALLHTLLLNPHTSTPCGMEVLNASLATQNWTLLDRAWSTTGYISVLESTSLHYRVLRCDHSLLGGEWLLTPSRIQNEKWQVNEPIYAVFEMLEAVRLLELVPQIPDSEATALVIGLGIGTAPKALLEHGIHTSIVELDPVVHRFATNYFSLPLNHTAIISDAVHWVSTSHVSDLKYDYILHDVFTGGAEPLALFTHEFLTNLRALLTPNGVIAINYAGDLSLPLTQHILRTITAVFEGHCKIFRDSEPATSTGPANDFANMVLFCRNTPGPITFRQPVQADFLRSVSRKHYLLPRAEWEIVLPIHAGNGNELMAGQEKRWAGQQVESATRHWRIMRTVLPGRVWELW